MSVTWSQNRKKLARLLEEVDPRTLSAYKLLILDPGSKWKETFRYRLDLLACKKFLAETERKNLDQVDAIFYWIPKSAGTSIMDS